jgi:hypothetical protein
MPDFPVARQPQGRASRVPAAAASVLAGSAAASVLARSAAASVLAGAAAALALAAGCAAATDLEPRTPPGKIAFDLSAISASGLTGPVDGRVAVDYEFCIPADAAAAAAVRRTDVTARCGPGRGRIGCGGGEWLCIGHTHRPGWRAVLERLAARDDIRRIERHFAE